MTKVVWFIALLIVDPVPFGDPPPYCQHEQSPQSSEDSLNLAPTYSKALDTSLPSGADKLAEWLVSIQDRLMNRSKGRSAKS
jgi:hypothetical protein